MKNYSKIPGNDKLLINLEGKIKTVFSKDKLEYLVEIKDNFVSLDMYGKKRTVEAKWLSILSCYNFKLIEGFEELIFRYKFMESFKGNESFSLIPYRTRLPFEVVFKEPVYYSSGFRIIAEFPRYAISENKEILDTETGKLVEINYIGKTGYPYVLLEHPYFVCRARRNIHILVCITWHENKSFKEYPLVNHKDGDKRNFRADNLEWVNYSDNLIHAYATGLRPDNHPVKVYDSKTKKVSIYHSVTEAYKAMGLKPRSNLEHYFRERNGFYISKKRYEIRYLSDTTDFDLKTMSVRKLEKKRQKEQRRNIPYKAINLNTREEFIGGNGVMQKLLGLSESGVTGIFRKKTVYCKADNTRWIIVDSLEKNHNLTEYKEVSNKKIEVVRKEISTGEEMVYKTMRRAGAENGKDPKTIARLIRDGELFKNRFVFRYK